MSAKIKSHERNFRNGLIAALSNRSEVPTLQEVEQLASQMAPIFNVSGDLKDAINEALTSVVTRMGAGVSLVDAKANHDDQWVRRREDITWTYSEAYEAHLQQDGWADTMVRSLSDVTGKILGLLQDPQSEGTTWNRRGLVIGHVQSGKTANYTGLIAKAADAGYKFIVVIAGIHNNLRKQTQERLEEAFIGRSSDPENRRKVGVGLAPQYPHPACWTTINEDFNKKSGDNRNYEIKDFSKPIILVIKKNVSTLESLRKYLAQLNAEGDGRIRDVPMLMIDDEADNASINTNKEDLDPTKTNAQIRRILGLFAKSCYVGYTATPFANIFINHEAYDDDVREELFPRDFIYALDAPNTYFGAEKVFLDEDTSDSVVKPITDCEDLIPYSHKRDDTITELPPSLYRALNQFIVARAIRNLRGQTGKHCSMMINVSRFVPIQRAVRDFISLREKKIREAVKGNYLMPEEVSSQNRYMQELKAEFEAEYSAVEFTWPEVKKALNAVFEHLHVYVINSQSQEVLDFSRYEKEGIGLTAIAVGGLSLSRGLTIEGLTVSYMYRNTKMYDTLMQMGRWFGYRHNFEDLCRVHLSQDSINWYGHIAQSAGELIDQIYRMRRLGKSPMDFGLYVKKHPDALLITARNKMRTGEDVVVEMSLSGLLRETYIVSTEKSVNDHNFSVIEKFWKRSFDGKESATKKGLIFREVPINTVIDFLLAFKTHKRWEREKEFAIDYLNVIAEKHQEADVLLISPKDGPRGNGAYELHQQWRKVDDGQPKGGSWNLASDRVASKLDEALGLSDPQIDEAKAKAKARAKPGKSGAPSDTHFREVRNKPLLMVHSLKAKDQEKIPDAIAAFGISFPFDEGRDKISVMANKIWMEQNYRAIDEDEDGDELDD